MSKGLNISYQNGQWEIKCDDTIVDCVSNLVLKANATDFGPTAYLECYVDKLSFEGLEKDFESIIVFANESFGDIENFNTAEKNEFSKKMIEEQVNLENDICALKKRINELKGVDKDEENASNLGPPRCVSYNAGIEKTL